jgi:UDP-N-acetylmuramoyl-L-alanyl-D-glutamate--2,6-diaminopimelate ligase
MTTAALIERFSQAGLLRAGGEGGVRPGEIVGVTSDSRAVKPGVAFVAIAGAKADGHAYIAKAVEKGVALVVAERQVEASVPVVQVTSSRGALAHASALLHGDPAERLKLMGVTGTNGKTTTAFLLHQMTEALGEKTGLIGTIETRIGDQVVPSTHTTPGPEALHRLLGQMEAAGCTHCALEVSSHALDQSRVTAVPFAAAAFTNLTRDHLDYHGTMEAYREAKERLFHQTGPGAIAAINLDDAAGLAMAQAARDAGADVVGYGETADANVRFELERNALDGLTLLLDGQRSRFRLVGEFNAYNLAAAYSVGVGMGYDAQAVRIALEQASAVPGRFEQFESADGRTVIVDYAHTPDALENVLRTARALMPERGRLWVLFGCGGDRDTTKRRPTAQIAERYADRCIVTSDNPRTEDPEQILADIRHGFDRPSEAAWIVDRREALRYAADHSAPGDVVLVTGKGHEDYMIVGTDKVPFDDRAIVRELFDVTQPTRP